MTRAVYDPGTPPGAGLAEAMEEIVRAGEQESVQWWLVLPSWNRLHYPKPGGVRWWKGETPGHFGDGQTVCGREGQLSMPGVFSRMGLQRCARCCDALGIPRGNGDPINDESIAVPSGGPASTGARTSERKD